MADPEASPGGLVQARPSASARSITLLQRKASRPGRLLGKTTGWIKRLALQAEGVRFQPAARYAAITAEGLRLDRPDGPELVPADTVVIRAGQEPNGRCSRRPKR